MNCTSCGAEISRQSTLCRDCAHDIHVKYIPDVSTIWRKAAEVRLRESEERGGKFCADDEAEKAWRDEQWRKQQNAFEDFYCE